MMRIVTLLLFVTNPLTSPELAIANGNDFHIVILCNGRFLGKINCPCSGPLQSDIIDLEDTSLTLHPCSHLNFVKFAGINI